MGDSDSSGSDVLAEDQVGSFATFVVSSYFRLSIVGIDEKV